MKTHPQKKLTVTIPISRWLAYAGAGAATALGSAAPAEAEIHYSGRVDEVFAATESKSAKFALDQAGDSISFAHTANGGGWADFFAVFCPTNGAFLGGYGSGFEYAYVFRLNKKQRNRYISQGPFTVAGLGLAGALGTMVKSDRSSLRWRWTREGTGFVGFRFNNGSGNQYGWVRVHLDGPAGNYGFTVVDYAWADLGETIKPGQTTSAARTTPDEGSLGLLALGAAGLALGRRGRRIKVKGQPKLARESNS